MPAELNLKVIPIWLLTLAVWKVAVPLGVCERPLWSGSQRVKGGPTSLRQDLASILMVCLTIQNQTASSIITVYIYPHISIYIYIITSKTYYDIPNFLQNIDVTSDLVGQDGRVDEAKLPENGALFSLFSLVWSYWRWPTSGGMGASRTISGFMISLCFPACWASADQLRWKLPSLEPRKAPWQFAVLAVVERPWYPG